MPNSPQPTARLRAVLGMGAVAVVSLVAAAALVAVAISPVRSHEVDVLVRYVFAWVGALACLRYTTAAVAGLLLVTTGARSHAPLVAPRAARRILDLLGPQWIKRLAAASLGTAALASVGVGAQADPPSPVPDSAWASADGATIVGLGQKVRPIADDVATVTTAPTLPATPAPSPSQPPPNAPSAQPTAPASVETPAVQPPTTSAPPSAESPAATTYIVQPGDSLWRIAQLHGADGESETSTAWPRWYELNRDLIGPDPDLIHPGQVLRVPTLDSAEPAS